MADNDSLLGFIAQRHTIGLEDVATDALFFILSPLDLRQRRVVRRSGGRPRTVTYRESGTLGGRCTWSRARSGLPRRG